MHEAPGRSPSATAPADQSKHRVIRFADHKLVPWKNGLGVTRELALESRADGGWLWRISIATVERSGPFSDFAGFDRHLMLLSGGEMSLAFAPEAEPAFTRSLRLLEPIAFDGAWPCVSTVEGAPLTDFNLVTAQGHAAGRMEVRAVDGAVQLGGSGVRVFYAVRGTLTVERASPSKQAGSGPVAVVLAEGDALRVDDAQGSWSGRAVGERSLLCCVTVSVTCESV